MSVPPGDAPRLSADGQDPADGGKGSQQAAILRSGLDVRSLLAQDPFLLYLDEGGDRYHVRHGADQELMVPKDRSLPEPYPAPRPALLQRAYHWLWLACLGLLLAGLGALLFASLAAAAAVGLNFQPISRNDRIRSLVILILASGLWLGGLLLGAVLLVHLI